MSQTVPSGQVVVGFIKRAHGVTGNILVVPITDNPDRFVTGAEFSVLGRTPERVTVTSVTPHNEGLVLALAEVSDRNLAEVMAKAELTIPSDTLRELAADEYWPHQLVGLQAVDLQDAPLGKVVDVVLGAAQDRLAVETPSGARIEVPFVAAIVGDPRDGRIPIDAPGGLFPDAETSE